MIGGKSVVALACPDLVRGNQDGECSVLRQGGFDIFAANSITSEESLSAIEKPDKHKEVKSQNYSVIKKSKEQKYPGALIVIETDEPIVAAPFPVQNIQRYWYDEE